MVSATVKHQIYLLAKINEKWPMKKIKKSIVNGSRGTGKTTLHFAFYALLV